MPPTPQADMMSPAKGPHQYSNNPSTMKARRRKMNLTGAKKVEDAARTADYKAMIYARGVLQKKPEYSAASDVQKEAMLETAMRGTMEKRREKGQDTMSKLAAYHSGFYRLRARATGPQTRVPISAFLQENGYVPPSAGRAVQNQDFQLADGINNDPATPCPVNPGLPGSAPVANMNGPNRLPSPDDIGGNPRPGSGPVLSPIGLVVNGNGHSHARESSNVLVSMSPGAEDFKQSGSLEPFHNMTPEPGLVVKSVEEDGDVDQVAALRHEVNQLRNMCQNANVGNSSFNYELENVRAQIGADQNRVTGLDRRLSQLEGAVHAIQNLPVATVVERVNLLETAIDDLNAKVGDGYDAEIANMREVFDGLRETMARVGGFL